MYSTSSLFLISKYAPGIYQILCELLARQVE